MEQIWRTHVSVVDITGKDGNAEQFNIGGSVSLLSTNAIVEAPFADGAGSFILTGRKSYQSDLYNDILESVTDQDQNAQAGTSIPGRFGLGQFQTEPESYFYDLNAKLTYRLPNDDKLSISVYNGADELDNSREIGGESSFLSDRCDAFNGQGPFGVYSATISVSLATVDLSEWGNTGMSAKLSRQWSDRFYSNFVLSGSQYFSNRDREIDRDVIFIEDDPSSNIPTSSQSSSNEVNQLDDLTLRIENDFYVDSRNTFGFGLQLTQQNIDYSFMQNGDLVIDTNNEATTATVYFEDEIVLDALTITPGVRLVTTVSMMRFTQNRDYLCCTRSMQKLKSELLLGIITNTPLAWPDRASRKARVIFGPSPMAILFRLARRVTSFWGQPI